MSERRYKDIIDRWQHAHHINDHSAWLALMTELAEVRVVVAFYPEQFTADAMDEITLLIDVACEHSVSLFNHGRAANDSLPVL